MSYSNRTAVKRITAIDLGTNSFHAVIVDVFPDGSFYTIDKLKEMVLLAEKGVGDRLSDQAMERGLNALNKIKTLADHQGSEKILAYATSAIREAENGGEFIQRAIDEIGVKVNAISGRIEAELIGMAVQHGVNMPENPSLIMDIGGGSVEFILADKQKFYFLTSKKVGVARMTADFVDNDPISKKEIEKLKEHFREQLKDVAQAFAMNRAKLLIGSSGTMQNIAMMIAARNKKSPALSINELEFSSDEFFEFYGYAIKLNHKKRLKLEGLDEKRVDIIAPGLVLVHFMLSTFAIKKVKISAQALREGIILRFIKKEFEMLKELKDVDNPRLRSVMELVHKYEWHEAHSRQVAKIAMKIFRYFKTELELSDHDGELLEYASYMHDIGYHISHKKHHKHALYIIRNSELRGFKEWEIEVMANVARYHRRSTPQKRHPFYDNLPPAQKDKVRKLSAILRVADGLDRSHYQNVQALEIIKSDSETKLLIKTEADPQLEIWGAMRKASLFEEVTGTTLSIEAVEYLQSA